MRGSPLSLGIAGAPPFAARVGARRVWAPPGSKLIRITEGRAFQSFGCAGRCRSASGATVPSGRTKRETHGKHQHRAQLVDLERGAHARADLKALKGRG